MPAALRGCKTIAGGFLLLARHAPIKIMSMTDLYEELYASLQRVHDLESAAALMEWDEEIYMPQGGAVARGRHLGTLKRTAHELFSSDRIGHLLDGLNGADFAPESMEACLVRVTRRDFQRARRIPASLVAELASAGAAARAAWREAKERNDYPSFAPHLKRMIELNIRKAEALGYSNQRYDALLDEFEPGMETATVTSVFNALRSDLVPLVAALNTEARIEDDFLSRTYPKQAQWDFGMRVLKDIGYDLNRGRQDISAHPFSTSFSISDVRITTRLAENYLPAGLFGTLHEAGHAMYEQGIDTALEGTLLAAGTSLSMHESQSRLWENQVGRSDAFWSHYFEPLQKVFPRQLRSVTQSDFYRAVNSVRPSLIRGEADEVTYNLHIMVRYELELLLINEDIGVEELPNAWNNLMEEYLGIRPETDADGVLQDIHWALGAFGYFPTYSLGNLMAAQLFAAAEERIQGLHDQLARGEFGPLREWLALDVHRHGRRLSADDILRHSTGSGLSVEPWLFYAKEKFGDLYGVSHV